MSSRLTLMMALSVLTAASCGCNSREWSTPELGQVQGTLTLDGRPLDNMMLIFEPDEGKQSMATTGPDGSFKAMYFVDQEGVKVGQCTVRVVPGLKGKLSFVPPRYSTESELVYDVVAGENVFDIELSSN